MRLTVSDLSRVNVTYNGDLGHIRLECQTCSHVWSPNQPPGGRRWYNNWYRCPNGCNAELIVNLRKGATPSQ
jgi:hypothetical protein